MTFNQKTHASVIEDSHATYKKEKRPKKEWNSTYINEKIDWFKLKNLPTRINHIVSIFQSDEQGEKRKNF